MRTGLYCHTHGLARNNIRLDPKLTTFAEIYVDAGYRTDYIGKWHLDGGVPKGAAASCRGDERKKGWQEWQTDTMLDFAFRQGEEGGRGRIINSAISK